VSSNRSTGFLPAILAAAAFLLLALWLYPSRPTGLEPRNPGADQAPEGGNAGASNPVLQGKLQTSSAQPSPITEAFPQFRGPGRDGIVTTTATLARAWNTGQPRQLWSMPVGEGYAGPVISQGRVYLMDYDRDHQHDALRCLSLEDGRELWRFSYPVKIKRNHGMSRTVPAIHSNLVVAIGPKCHVLCLDATTGELKWGIDMVNQFGATVPPWYTGQCPLIEKDLVILAPGGPQALLVAVNLHTGELVWTSPNPRGWKMTHASVMSGELAGQHTLVYCASGGVAGVGPDGKLLWDTAEWKISIATVPSPLLLSPDRVFLTGGYDAGSMMLQVQRENGLYTTRSLFRLDPKAFGATQHTPILFNRHIYGVHPDGQFMCLDPDGKPLWSSGHDQRFGLGPFLIANDLIYALNDSGLLSLMPASPDRHQLLAQAKVLSGRESWGPMALAGGRLLIRDLENLVCLHVGD
jgi:outer membrane protein assembly factor BamB